MRGYEGHEVNVLLKSRGSFIGIYRGSTERGIFVETPQNIAFVPWESIWQIAIAKDGKFKDHDE